MNLKKKLLKKKIKNFTINFGPQHPAAHGVLRLMLQLNNSNLICYIISLWTCLSVNG